MRVPKLALLLVTVTVLLAACGEDGTVGPSTMSNSLTFTRSDQTSISFATTAELYVWCGPWEEGAIPAHTLHVVLGGPGVDDPVWRLSAIVADVAIGVPLVFPNNFVFDVPKNVDLFIADPSATPPNELSTQATDSNGSITFQALQCDGDASVRFSLDAIVASEFGDGPSVRVAGEFQAAIGSPPR